MMKPLVTLTVGVPASGKTTWARAEARNTGAVIVSRDDIRLAHGLGSGEDENFVTKVHRAQIEAALLDGSDVIVADTNLNKTFRKRLVKFAHEHGADVMVKVFPVSLDEAIKRDINRANHVGADVIRRFHKMAQEQGFDTEGFEFIPAPTYEPYKHYEGFGHGQRKRAVVVDIDGTLAHMNGRSPYDETRVGEDDFDNEVAASVQGLSQAMNAEVIVVSGRTEACAELTEDWLELHHFKYDALLMRKHGDQRPDYVVKNEIYDAEIIPHYDILAVFDDRDQVVRHLRARGIKVFQVAPGRF